MFKFTKKTSIVILLISCVIFSLAYSQIFQGSLEGFNLGSKKKDSKKVDKKDKVKVPPKQEKVKKQQKPTSVAKANSKFNITDLVKPYKAQ